MVWNRRRGSETGEFRQRICATAFAVAQTPHSAVFLAEEAQAFLVAAVAGGINEVRHIHYLLRPYVGIGGTHETRRIVAAPFRNRGYFGEHMVGKAWMTRIAAVVR